MAWFLVILHIDDQPESGQQQHLRLCLDIYVGQQVKEADYGAFHLFAWMTNGQLCKYLQIHGSAQYFTSRARGIKKHEGKILHIVIWTENTVL